MKPICLSLALLASAAHGELVITEVMASSAHPTNVAPTPDANGDWWELTNTGSVAVDLTGYKWDDVPTPLSPTVSIFPPGVTIQPGESIIILEEPSENVALGKQRGDYPPRGFWIARSSATWAERGFPVSARAVTR